MSDVLAILCADLHLSHKPPAARSAEESWYDAMARPLRQLRELAEDHANIPVICAGDVFDRWNSPPELVNFAIANLPKMYAVPGQHDLPHHSYDYIGCSAYWTLVEAGKIVNLSGYQIGGLVLWGFPWGEEITGPEKDGSDGLSVAVVHQYCWKELIDRFAEAPVKSHISRLAGRLRGYDVAVFGDNHRPFEARAGSCDIFNCGCLIPRSIDERGHRPSVGLLMDDDTVLRHYLDTSEDEWVDAVEEEPDLEEDNMDLDGFLHELGELSAESLDFQRALRRYVERELVEPAVRKILLEVVEKLGD